MSIDTESFKESYKKYIEELIKASKTANDDEGEISLFHGTSLYYLNNILEKGLLSRGKTNISNWDKNQSICENTYLTNKWHYFYAINCFMKLFDEIPDEMKLSNLPCYIEFKVSKNKLLLDEDFFASKYVERKVKKSIKNNQSLSLTWEECLNHYGTVAHLGDIPPESIVSFTILGDIQLIVNNFMDNKSQYYKDYIKWQERKGKGALKLKDLLLIESKSPLNATWWKDSLPENAKITGVYFDNERNKLRLIYEK